MKYPSLSKRGSSDSFFIGLVLPFAWPLVLVVFAFLAYAYYHTPSKQAARSQPVVASPVAVGNHTDDEIVAPHIVMTMTHAALTEGYSKHLNESVRHVAGGKEQFDYYNRIHQDALRRRISEISQPLLDGKAQIVLRNTSDEAARVYVQLKVNMSDESWGAGRGMRVSLTPSQEIRLDVMDRMEYIFTVEFDGDSHLYDPVSDIDEYRYETGKVRDGETLLFEITSGE